MQAALEVQLSVPRTHSLMSTSQLGPSNLHNHAHLESLHQVPVAKALSQGGRCPHTVTSYVGLLACDMASNSSKHVGDVMLCRIKNKPQNIFGSFWKQNLCGDTQQCCGVSPQEGLSRAATEDSILGYTAFKTGFLHTFTEHDAWYFMPLAEGDACTPRE